MPSLAFRRRRHHLADAAFDLAHPTRSGITKNGWFCRILLKEGRGRAENGEKRPRESRAGLRNVRESAHVRVRPVLGVAERRLFLSVPQFRRSDGVASVRGEPERGFPALVLRGQLQARPRGVFAGVVHRHFVHRDHRRHHCRHLGGADAFAAVGYLRGFGDRGLFYGDGGLRVDDRVRRPFRPTRARLGGNRVLPVERARPGCHEFGLLHHSCAGGMLRRGIVGVLRAVHARGRSRDGAAAGAADPHMRVRQAGSGYRAVRVRLGHRGRHHGRRVHGRVHAPTQRERGAGRPGGGCAAAGRPGPWRTAGGDHDAAEGIRSLLGDGHPVKHRAFGLCGHLAVHDDVRLVLPAAVRVPSVGGGGSPQDRQLAAGFSRCMGHAFKRLCAGRVRRAEHRAFGRRRPTAADEHHHPGGRTGGGRRRAAVGQPLGAGPCRQQRRH